METTPTLIPEPTMVNLQLRWQGRQLQTRVALPTVPVSPRVFLPMVQQLTSAVVGLAEAAVQDQGQSVSCRAGCGACCRQVVPVSETEAWYVRDLIEDLPEQRRQIIRDRFAAGRQRLADAELLEAFQDTAAMTDRVGLGMAYFQLGIACPFLEEESCSIHPDRPVSCREYLVTSPAENCLNPTRETVRQVPLPTRPLPAFSSLDGPTPTGGVRWVPLLLAPEWADEHPEPDATEAGMDLFSRFMAALNKYKFPGSPDPVPLPEGGST